MHEATATDKEIKMAKGIAILDKEIQQETATTLVAIKQHIEKVQERISQQQPVSCADALKRANEDAGEGHMSKSQLYATAKMAIELLDMIT